MELNTEYLQRALLTVDYKPLPELLDEQGKLISLFMDDMPLFELGFDKNTKSFLRMRSAKGDRNLHVGLSQFTYFVDGLEALDVFTEAAVGKTRGFLLAMNTGSLTRLGIRLIYRVPIETNRFLPLLEWYDIPGIQDPRISKLELIHYQITLQGGDNRIIVVLGQQQEEGKFYRTINLHHQYLNQTKPEDLEANVSNVISVLLDEYREFQKEE
jgi:hypothetical protein